MLMSNLIRVEENERKTLIGEKKATFFNLKYFSMKNEYINLYEQLKMEFIL